MIILAVWVAGGTIHFPIIATKGKPINHTAIPITTIPVVPGIRPIIDTATTIRTLIVIIGIHTLTIAVTGGLDHLPNLFQYFFGIFSTPGLRDRRFLVFMVSLYRLP